VWDYRNITALSTVTIPGPCDLIAVVVNTAAASAVVAITDGVTAGSRPVASIDASATGNFFYGCECKNGITAVLSGGTANVTVILDQYATDENA
jgi:hypothetical protein